MFEVAVNNSPAVKIEFKENNPILNGEAFDWDLIKTGNNQFHILKDNKSYNAEVVNFNKEEKLLSLRINNNIYEVAVKDRFDILLHQMGMDNVASQKVNDLKAPMPGLVLKIMVEENQAVKKGDSLIILEAMKMENVLKAAGDGVVKKIVAKEKTTVEKGQLLIVMG